MSDPRAPQGDFLTVEEHIATAKTLPLQGIDLLTRIRGIARAQIGRKEEGGKNWGAVVIDAATPLIKPERLATFGPGQKNAGKLEWCSLFAGDCILQGLEADGRPPEQLREWRRIAASEVPVFHERMKAAGLIAPFVPGEAPPPDTIVAFFRRLAHVEIYDQTLGMLAVCIGGNSGRQATEVAENKHLLTSADIDCWGRLPW